jgi:hypothetical protein
VTGIVVITIEGVLSSGDDLRQAQPTKQAKALYDGLRSQHNTIGLTRATEEIAKWWLRREYLANWSSVLAYPGTSAFTYEAWRLDQLRGMLAEGWEIFAFVDRSPDLVEEAVALGIPGLCVSYPHMPPGWREVGVPRSWEGIVATVDSQP